MELYHVFNRGVEKRTIFMDGKDNARFVHDMWEFNDKENSDNTRHRARKNITGFVNPYIAKDRIVDVHGWCLMKNHYHLLISERVDGGLSKFLKRLNIGYANYFNERYARSGALFQGRTKKVQITRDAHFLHILNYVHCNPLDFSSDSKGWRTEHIRNSDKAITVLEKYRWSSYLDYIGIPNFPSVLTTDLFRETFKDYKREIRDFLYSRTSVGLGSQYQLE